MSLAAQNWASPRSGFLSSRTSENRAPVEYDRSDYHRKTPIPSLLAAPAHVQLSEHSLSGGRGGGTAQLVPFESEPFCFHVTGQYFERVQTKIESLRVLILIKNHASSHWNSNSHHHALLWLRHYRCWL